LSVWPDSYYVTYNLFNASGTAFLGAEICAMDRAAMLAGTTATQQCHTTSNAYGGLLAADFEGGTPPPAGKPNTVLALGTTSTTLASWVYHVDWANPNNSTFAGPSNVTVAGYTTACGASGTCVPQKGWSGGEATPVRGGAHWQPLLGQDLAQLLHRFVDASLHEGERKAEGLRGLRCGMSLEVRLQQDLAVLGAE
jgi:hypothetical protein